MGSGNCVKTFKGHRRSVESAIFSADFKQVLTASNDNTAKLWDIKSGDCVKTFEHAGCVMTAIFSSDSNQVLTASADGTAKLWDVKSGNCVKTFGEQGDRIWITESQSDILIKSAIFSSDSKRVLTACYDPYGNAKLWDIKSGSCVKIFKDHDGPVNSAIFVPTGNAYILRMY